MRRNYSGIIIRSYKKLLSGFLFIQNTSFQDLTDNGVCSFSILAYKRPFIHGAASQNAMNLTKQGTVDKPNAMFAIYPHGSGP